MRNTNKTVSKRKRISKSISAKGVKAKNEEPKDVGKSISIESVNNTINNQTSKVDDEKWNKLSIILKIIPIVLSIISIIISSCTFQFTIDNHPLVISDGGRYVVDDEEFIFSCKVNQGHVKNAYLVYEKPDVGIIYEPLRVNRCLRSIEITVPLSQDKESSDYSGNVIADMNLPSIKYKDTQEFYLVLVDYKDELTMYYGVVLPKPVLSEDLEWEFRFTSSRGLETKETFALDNVENWESKVYLLDCKLVNTNTIEQMIPQSSFCKKFELFTKERTVKMDSGEAASTNPALIANYSYINPREVLNNIDKIKADIQY